MRQTLFIAGLLLLGLTWLGPLPGWARLSFTAHMTMHMSVVAVVAPLIAMGVAGGRFDPVHRAPAVFSPVPASLLELVIVWAWHAPALHHYARHSLGGMVLEQGLFLCCGLLLWLSALGGAASGTRVGAGIVGLLLTSMHMTLLGALLALAPRPLYGHMEGVGGLSALADQHLGGAIMLLVGGLSYLCGGLWLTVLLLRHRVHRSAGTS